MQRWKRKKEKVGRLFDELRGIAVLDSSAIPEPTSLKMAAWARSHTPTKSELYLAFEGVCNPRLSRPLT